MPCDCPVMVFIAHDGTEYKVQAEIGQSVMQSAITASVPGILADCGGQCSCATCHGYVDKSWFGRLPKPDSMETDMLTVAMEPRDNSRLTCQIKMTADLDGIVIQLPESQL